jgi:hypothetical protein
MLSKEELLTRMSNGLTVFRHSENLLFGSGRAGIYRKPFTGYQV